MDGMIAIQFNWTETLVGIFLYLSALGQEKATVRVERRTEARRIKSSDLVGGPEGPSWSTSASKAIGLGTDGEKLATLL